LEVHPATLWEAVADEIPAEPALVQGSVRRTWRAFDARSARLAGFLAASGLGAGSKVGQLLYNSTEFVESYFAALKIRAIPFNINYRYTGSEVAYLLDNADADVLVFHSSLSDVVSLAMETVTRPIVLVEVDDGGRHLDGAMRYEDAVAATSPAPRIVRSPDDVTMIYTGGTTGMPKGVISKVGPVLAYTLQTVPLLVGHAPLTVDEVPAFARRLAETPDRIVALPAPPLIHNTALAMGMVPALAIGGTVVLEEARSFDADALWSTVARERVNSIVVVGDAFARPLLASLEADPGRDLTCVRVLSSSGAMFSAEIKDRLLAHLPQAVIVDIIGSSEGTMGMSISTSLEVSSTGRFQPAPGVILIDEHGRPVERGSREPGLVALPGGAEGYYKDEAKSAATFKVIDGTRYTIPGDLATIEEDGSLSLVGRGSSCINTGGEKVYPEEVEEVLKTLPSVEDALVFGVDDERFGQTVCAVVSSVPGSTVSVPALVAAAKVRLAAYKVPRSVRLVAVVPRTQVGKADYAAARAMFTAAGG
jgi:fatty-acyl-CoA synthase